MSPGVTRQQTSAGEIDRGVDLLSEKILKLANIAIPRVDFMRRVTDMVRDYLAAHFAEIWVEEEGSCARFRAAAVADGGFEFEMVECAGGEVGGGGTTSGAPPCELVQKLVRRNRRTGGRYWIGDRPPDCRHPNRPCVPPAGVLSTAVIPLTVGGDAVGWVMLHSRLRDHFTRRRLESFSRVAATLGVAVVNQRAQAALRERVKELTGLYRLAQLAEQPGISLPKLLQGIAELLPPAWQYPEITVGTVVLDGQCFATAEAGEEADRQRAEIMIAGVSRGHVEVAYVQKRPRLAEGPFLMEERSLLDAFAREIASIIERRQAEDERSRLRGQLLHADRLATIGQLAAGVAHELNEPLGAVLGFAQLAQRSPELPSQAGADLNKIEAAALHAREIVKKLMFFARQTPPRTERVSLNRIVEEGLYFLEARWASKGIELQRQLESNLPEITADPSQLQQVLVNLAVNAEQAMPEGGRLTISTETGDASVLLRVEDSGVGISAELQGQVFLPFFTTKDVNEGTGLGLAVVHGIVTSHGGTIRMRSEEGAGTCFEIELLVSGSPTG